MSIEIIVVDNEILQGITLNTNGALLCKILANLGYCSLRHTILPDTSDFLGIELLEALFRSSFTVVVSNCDFKYNGAQHIKDIAKNWFLSSPTILENQENGITGFIFDEDGKTLLILSSIPQEKYSLFEKEFVSILKRSLKFEKYFQPEVVHYVHNTFIKKGLKLACAESCTGGQLASKVTSIPGASNYFIASLVTYSNTMKEKLLGVKKETLKKFGAISKECVLEMSEGVLRTTQADMSLAISGIAGPDGGTKENPVGTVWLAIGQKGGPSEAFSMQLKGNRDVVIFWAVQKALFHLWKKISFYETPLTHRQGYTDRV